ncbi:uncharacterized protein LOC132699619 [Cylas formicarius]|uniref:uncharacterized protein LOC132699619 n=1 Tax=Cylas formicarius TaxID=197179 RepID=UPI0029587429|nr:uncharacterized protein LOC132699619 [Cylas formicarius]
MRVVNPRYQVSAEPRNLLRAKWQWQKTKSAIYGYSPLIPKSIDRSNSSATTKKRQLNLQPTVDDVVIKQKNNISVNISPDLLKEACTELLTVYGRPFSMFNDSDFRKILDLIIAGLTGLKSQYNGANMLKAVNLLEDQQSDIISDEEENKEQENEEKENGSNAFITKQDASIADIATNSGCTHFAHSTHGMLEKLLLLKYFCRNMAKMIGHVHICNVLNPAKKQTAKLFQTAHLLGGDFYSTWLQRKMETSKICSRFSKNLVESLNERENAQFYQDVTMSATFLDPRFKVVLSTSQILKHINEGNNFVEESSLNSTSTEEDGMKMKPREKRDT